MTPSLPDISLGEPWEIAVQGHVRAVLRRDGDQGNVTVVLERCAAGRLKDAYPVGEHDIEAQVMGTPLDAPLLTTLLGELVTGIERADPACRRIIYAATEGDIDRVRAAEEAGFRFVVDVDLHDASLSLLVAEPDWVTYLDSDDDAVTATPADRVR